MEQLKEIIEKHTVVILNEAIKHGFTQLPNYVLKAKKLSFGARLSYSVLLSYAWQEDSCFPGQNRMAEDLGCTSRMLRNYLNELKKYGFVDWKRRGLNKTNVYYILDYKPIKIKAERKPVSAQERK